jgi:threonine synthase
MLYRSTRDHDTAVTAAKAITQGISVEGGLFVPEELPQLTKEDLNMLVNQSYVERATYILSLFLTDFTDAEIHYCTEHAYTDKKFKSNQIAEISHLFDGTYMLELWHGPTCAFKDMALQILPYLLTTSAKKEAKGKKIVILVATSGDTGKAALEGFKDVEDTQILVFYPEDGVSAMQKRQMTTQEGNNVAVSAIVGNFDDAQTGVKQIFTDPGVVAKLAEHNMMFSSANSINWGRLLPQIVYYVSTYCELVKDEEISMGDVVNVTVPTGNFGNILAAYYAKQMGVPLGKLVCASNANHVLTDFIKTGTYNRNREFHTTISPSMDILISSNLERLLYDLCGKDDTKIKAWFNELRETGSYTVDDTVMQRLSEEFYAGYCDDEQTKETIGQIFKTYSYLCDTHTAVAVRVAQEYKKETGDDRKMIVVSTASPYKFAPSVLSAVCDQFPQDPYEQLSYLEQLSKLEVPKALSSLKEKEVRFTGSVKKEEMEQVVLSMLGLH